MRATRWLLATAVTGALLAAGGCGATEVTVQPTGAAGGSACIGEGSESLCVGPDGVTATSDRGRLAVSPDGVTATGDRGSLAVDSDTASAGGSPATGGATGTVEIAGAAGWRGPATATCERMSDTMRSLTARLPQGELIISTMSDTQAGVILDYSGNEWFANWLSNANEVLTLTEDAIQLRSAALTDGAGSAVTVTASFDC